MVTETQQSPDSRHELLLVIDHFYPYVGGNETLYWNIARALVRSGWTVRVVTCRDADMLASETLEGVQITRIWTPKFGQRLFFQLFSVGTLWQQSRRADLVHAVVYASALPAWLVAWLRGKPYILTVHEVFGQEWAALTDIGQSSATILRAFEWLLLHLPFTQYHCGVQFTARRLQKIGGIDSTRISVIPYTVDYDFWDVDKHTARSLREELTVPVDCFLYLYFGRPGASKGVEYLVDAADLVRQAVPNSRLVMLLGREPHSRYQRIKDQIVKAGLEHHIRLLQPVPRAELPSYLLAADCVVVPSLSEGFGYSAIEAATLGCRVVSTTGHAVEEVLADDVELVPPRDAKSLAERIIQISRNPLPRHPTLKRYDTDTHLVQLVATYKRLLDSPANALSNQTAKS